MGTSFTHVWRKLGGTCVLVPGTHLMREIVVEVHGWGHACVRLSLFAHKQGQAFFLPQRCFQSAAFHPSGVPADRTLASWEKGLGLKAFVDR